MGIDDLFSIIMDNCLLLNEYGPNMKYSTRNQVTKQNINEILVSLNAICNFPPIKAMRDSFSKEHKYEIVGEITAGQKSDEAAAVPQKSE